MVIYGVPKGTPRSGPNGVVPYVDLVHSVGAQLCFHLKNRGPEDGPRTGRVSCPERGIVVIFSL
jgi:hypothetical protein